jgi:hypothetical protein
VRRAASAAIQPKSVTIAIRNEALPQGKIRNATNSALAASETTPIGRQLGSPRIASAIVSGASTPVAMINRNAIPWIQQCHVSGFPPLSIGVSTLKAASFSEIVQVNFKPQHHRPGPEPSSATLAKLQRRLVESEGYHRHGRRGDPANGAPRGRAIPLGLHDHEVCPPKGNP